MSDEKLIDILKESGILGGPTSIEQNKEPKAEPKPAGIKNTPPDLMKKFKKQIKNIRQGQSNVR
jgi:hypothetical protein